MSSMESVGLQHKATCRGTIEDTLVQPQRLGVGELRPLAIAK